MDPKRELTSVDLAALVHELGRYEGAIVDKAYLYGDDLVRLKLRDFDRGRVELLCEVGDIKRAHTVSPERVPDAPGRPPQFAMMLRNRLAGGKLVTVEQFGFDRILEFVFERDDGTGTTRLIVELFGQGNVAVTDGEYQVIDCLETVRLKSRTVVPGSRYQFPEARTNPLTMSREAFEVEMNQSDTDVVRTLATQLNFGGLYAEELCSRAGVEKTVDIDRADQDTFDRLYESIERLALDLRTGTIDPRLYFESEGERTSGTDVEADTVAEGDAGTDAEGDADDVGDANAVTGAEADTGADEAADTTTRPPDERPDGRENANHETEPNHDDSESARVVDVTPFPLEERAQLRAEPYDSFTQALDDYFHRLELTPDEPEQTAQRPDFEERIAKQERIIEQQSSAIEGFDAEADSFREKAELLYTHYELVDEILTTIRNARDEGHTWDEIEDRFAEGRERGIDAARAVIAIDSRRGTVTVEVEDVPVELQTQDGVEKNADRLYTEAKNVESKKEGALEAIEETRETLAEIERQRDTWDAEEGTGVGERETADKGESEAEATDRDWLTESSIPVRRDEQWYERFRWFHTSNGFLVIGGRNADQNEELVKKYLERGDKVLHTQAHGGPVTVLKATDPSEASSKDIEIPDRSVEEAAQFAVSYSSVWKDGRYAGDVYVVDSDQVSKTPESGEYLEKGGFAVRGDRRYLNDTSVGVTVGVQCEPLTRVIGGPPSAIEDRAVTTIRVEPGRFAQSDAAKRIYRRLRERFADETFVRKIASPDKIQHFLPPGGSRIAED